MAVTIKQVLANKDKFPASLVAIATTLQNGKSAYAKVAADAASQSILAADELSIDAGELKMGIGNLIDLRQAVNDRADAAFAEAARDYEDVQVPSPSPPPPPPAPAPEPASAAPTNA